MMLPLTEEQIAYERIPIPFTPFSRLERGKLYVRKRIVPHSVYGYAQSYDLYSVLDLAGYRKGYEPRTEILGVYTPNPKDVFRLQNGHLPPYQPTTTGDKLQEAMASLPTFEAWRIAPDFSQEKSTHTRKIRTAYYAQAWVGETLESSSQEFDVVRKTLEEAQRDMERWKQNPKVLAIEIYKGKQEFIEDVEAGRAGGYWQLAEYEEWETVESWTRPGFQPQNLPEHWDLTKTDMPYYNALLKNPEYYKKEKGVEGRIVNMPPEQYMTVAGTIHKVPRQREYQAVVGSILKEYAARMKKGEKFPIPVLDLAAGLQEGRHRVAAAQWLGESTVPVLIVQPVSAEESKIQYGTCYEDAWRFVIKEEEGYLIHGTVLSDGKRIGHAWVETLTGYVWEPETKKFYPRGLFQEITQAKEEHRYTPEQAAIMAARTHNTGPWTDEERRRYISEGRSPETMYLKPEPGILTQLPRGSATALKRWWNRTYGSQSVIRTNGRLDAIVKHLGYQSIDISPENIAHFKGVIPTDQDLVNESQQRLSQVHVIPDISLSEKQRVHLGLSRAIGKEEGLRSVQAANIPPASDRVRTAGMYARSHKAAYIAPEQLEHGRTTVDTTIHETAHHTSGAEDGEESHNREIGRIAGDVVRSTSARRFDTYLRSPSFIW